MVWLVNRKRIAKIMHGITWGGTLFILGWLVIADAILGLPVYRWSVVIWACVTAAWCVFYRMADRRAEIYRGIVQEQRKHLERHYTVVVVPRQDGKGRGENVN